MTVFEARHIGVQYQRNGEPFAPFSDVSLALEGGRMYNLTGPSGSGKSTLLAACALMLPRSGGSLALNGVPFDRFHPTEWRRRVCLVPQASALVPGTVRDNLRFPWTLKVNAGTEPPSDEFLEELLALAQLNGVTLDHSAAQLSGGQQQRAAIARAIVAKPGLILADEPTGNLDSVNGSEVMQLLNELHRDGATIIMVTHSHKDASNSDRIINLFDGQIVENLNDKM